MDDRCVLFGASLRLGRRRQYFGPPERQVSMVDDEERRMISKRTKEALAAAKRRGVKLGGYRGAKITRKIVRRVAQPLQRSRRQGLRT